MDEAAYAWLKRKVDTARQTRDQATGKLDGVMERLKKEFGCTTIEAAEKRARQLASEAEKAETAFEAIAAKFEEDYREHLKD